VVRSNSSQTFTLKNLKQTKTSAMNATAPASRAGDSNLWLIVVLAALALALLWFVCYLRSH